MKTIKGDLVSATVDGDVDVMLHVCNCQGVMGSGIAKQVKKYIPATFNRYKEHHALWCLELGDVILEEGVANLMAQKFYGRDRRHLNYGALSQCLATLAEELVYLQGELDKPTITVGVPFKMGSGLAGGSWEVVSELVEYYLGHHNLVCYQL